MKRTALIVGATGLTGSYVTRMLCECGQYGAVTALSQKTMAYRHPILHTKVIDFSMFTEEMVEPVDDVFITTGPSVRRVRTQEAFERLNLEFPVKIAALAKRKGAQHVLVVSSRGAAADSYMFCSRVKKQLELQLSDLKLPRLSIFRPSLLSGKKQNFRIAEHLAERVLQLTARAFVGPLEKFRPVRAETVAAAMVRQALVPLSEAVSVFTPDEIRYAVPYITT